MGGGGVKNQGFEADVNSGWPLRNPPLHCPHRKKKKLFLTGVLLVTLSYSYYPYHLEIIQYF